MQNSLWTSSPQTYVKWPKNFRWMSKNDLTFLSTEKNFSSPWTGRLLFRQSLLKIFDKRPIFSAHCREVKRKSWNVFFNLLSSNRSYGQVECTFDNPYKNILREGWKIFTPCPKLIRNSYLLKTLIFSPTYSSEHVESNFDNTWKSFANRQE